MAMLSLGHLTHYWHHQWHTSNICTKRLRSDQTGGDPQFGSFRSPFPPSSTRQLQQQSSYHKSQGDFNCGSSSQAGFILNYFLLNFLSISSNVNKFPLKFCISTQPGWQAETIKVTLSRAVRIKRKCLLEGG